MMSSRLTVIPAIAALWLSLAGNSIGQFPQQGLRGNNGCTWQSIQCLADNGDRLLKGVAPAIQAQDMTVEKCTRFCEELSYKWAGLEDGQYCYCDNQFSYVAEFSRSCNRPCPGNTWQMCGGMWTLSMYKCADPAPGPDGLSNCQWQQLGCYQDFSDRRLIPEMHFEDAYMSVDQCISFCYKAKYPFAGLEDGRHCFCGYGLLYQSAQVTACSRVCPGNSNQLCGGVYALNVYQCASPGAVAQQRQAVAQQQKAAVVERARNNPALQNQNAEFNDRDTVASVPWSNRPIADPFLPQSSPDDSSSPLSGSDVEQYDETGRIGTETESTEDSN